VLCPEWKENYWSYTFYGHSSKRCVRYILQPFFTLLTDKEKVYGHFQQDSATAHAAKHSMQALHEVSDDIVTSHGLWPSCSPEINPCGCFLWGYLKNKVHINNPHISEELEESIQFQVSKKGREQLQCVSHNMFKK
jgi:hypothetical protein